MVLETAPAVDSGEAPRRAFAAEPRSDDVFGRLAKSDDHSRKNNLEEDTESLR